MVYSRDSWGSALAAFRPVFSVRVLRLGALVDFVLAGWSCGRVDLNSAVYPPAFKFCIARCRLEVCPCLSTCPYDGI